MVVSANRCLLLTTLVIARSSYQNSDTICAHVTPVQTYNYNDYYFVTVQSLSVVTTLSKPV